MGQLDGATFVIIDAVLGHESQVPHSCTTFSTTTLPTAMSEEETKYEITMED